MSDGLLLRKRLIDAISEGGNKVTYIYGPAGFGKTILAKQWSALEEKPTIWFTGFSTEQLPDLYLDFINAIVETLPTLKNKLQNIELIENQEHDFIRNIFQIISDSKLRINFIIENAEQIRQKHKDFSRVFVSEIPANVSLILLTRTMPRSDFLRNFPDKKFNLIGPEKLKFNDEEILKLASQIGVELSEENLKLINDFTDGWPAGIDIVLSNFKGIQNLSELNQFLKTKGKEQFKLLSQKTLLALDKKEHNLLLKISLFDEIDTETALDISQDSDAVRILTVLSQNTIIANQTQALPPVFRLHPIIRQTLLDDFLSGPDANLGIENAVGILIKKDDIRQAISILLEIGETRRLREILNDPKMNAAISKSIYESIMLADISKIRSWIAVSDYAYGVGQSLAQFLRIYVNILSGNLESSVANMKLLMNSLSLVDQELKDRYLGDALALNCLVNFAQGKLNEVVEGAERAFEELKRSGNTEKHQVTYIQLAAFAAVIRDDESQIAKIESILEDQVFIDGAKARGINILAIRAVLAAHQGKLKEAQNNLVSYASKVGSTSVRGFFADFASSIVESIILLEAGEVEKSIEVLKLNAKNAEEAFNYPMAITSLGRLSYHYILKGDSDLALEAMNRGRMIIAEKQLDHELDVALDIWEIRLRFHLRDNERTQQLLRRMRPSYSTKSFEASIYISSAPGKALEIIETFNRKFPRQALTYHLHRAHILHDAPKLQLDEVKKAVDIGSKHGYFYHFLTQRSDVIQQYISLASEHPTLFNEKLARAAGEKLSVMFSASNQEGNALTRREADILRHLATGLPISQIAKNLSISKNTIKTHLRHLYRKLGAADRGEAVSKGRKLLKV